MNTQLITKKLSDYLGSDIDDLLNFREAIVFGGAIRDILSGEETVLNDIDILLSPTKAMHSILEILLAQQYRILKNYIKVDMIEMYRLVSITCPTTLINSNFHKVQLIIPILDVKTVDDLVEVAGFVDISCCGVAYHPTIGIVETEKDAIEHCKRKIFRVCKQNKFYSGDRTSHRVDKLIERGWLEV